jgi:hypothetical protein
MWRAVRLVVDRGMHHWGSPVATLFQGERGEGGKNNNNRSTDISPGPARRRHKIGELKIKKREARSVRELEKFDLKSFTTWCSFRRCRPISWNEMWTIDPAERARVKATRQCTESIVGTRNDNQPTAPNRQVV